LTQAASVWSGHRALNSQAQLARERGRSDALDKLQAQQNDLALAERLLGNPLANEKVRKELISRMVQGQRARDQARRDLLRADITETPAGVAHQPLSYVQLEQALQQWDRGHHALIKTQAPLLNTGWPLTPQERISQPAFRAMQRLAQGRLQAQWTVAEALKRAQEEEHNSQKKILARANADLSTSQSSGLIALILLLAGSGLLLQKTTTTSSAATNGTTDSDANAQPTREADQEAPGRLAGASTEPTAAPPQPGAPAPPSTDVADPAGRSAAVDVVTAPTSVSPNAVSSSLGPTIQPPSPGSLGTELAVVIQQLLALAPGVEALHGALVQLSQGSTAQPTAGPLAAAQQASTPSDGSAKTTIGPTAEGPPTWTALEQNLEDLLRNPFKLEDRQRLSTLLHDLLKTTGPQGDPELEQAFAKLMKESGDGRLPVPSRELLHELLGLVQRPRTSN
jgi:hypothetical protein